MSERERRILELLNELLEPDSIGAAIELLKHSERGKMFVARFLVAYADEENTDDLIAFMFEKIELPWWVPERLIRGLLDRQLPELALAPLVGLLVDSPDPESDAYAYVKRLNEEQGT